MVVLDALVIEEHAAEISRVVANDVLLAVLALAVEEPFERLGRRLEVSQEQADAIRRLYGDPRATRHARRLNSSNWSTIQPLLTGYNSGDLTNIQNNYINQGFRVILPQTGNITQGGWTGVGWLGIGTNPAGLQEITYGISSNLKGAYTVTPFQGDDVSPPVEATAPVIPPVPAAVSTEPIDLYTGAYLYDRDDLTVGSTAFPFGLTFHRSYNSNNRLANGPLGLGWTHSFAIGASMNSDGLKGLGQDSPIDGAAAIAEAFVSQDLVSDPNKPLLAAERRRRRRLNALQADHQGQRNSGELP